MSELEELKLAYAECSRQRNELLNKLKSQAQQERNFCPRCGKRIADLTTIHTCTPPIAADPEAFHGFPSGSESAPNAGGKCVTDGETSPVKEIDPNAWAFDRGLEST